MRVLAPLEYYVRPFEFFVYAKDNTHILFWLVTFDTYEPHLRLKSHAFLAVLNVADEYATFD